MENINMAINNLNREDLDQLEGLAIIEFGASWCVHCQAAEQIISAALIKYPHIRHIKIEDGKGEKLGRSYFVALWPTLILLKNGTEIKRLVCPNDSETIDTFLNEVSKS